jgi:large subunit ribosomal protein L31
MKQGIHPPYGDTLMRCACGNEIVTRSTRPHVSVEVCSRCHPYFTGGLRPADPEGRIARFRRRYRKLER